MVKYRKKSEEVEAVIFDGTTKSFSELAPWEVAKTPILNADGTLLIPIFDGIVITVNIGDYIVKSKNGSIFPYKSREFERAYETLT